MNIENKVSDHYFSSNPKSKNKTSLITAILRHRKFEFLTSSSVFSKKRIDIGTRLLIEKMKLPDKGTVLDLGCGYGAIGIVAASINPNLKVLLIDINSRAIYLTRLNIRKNRIVNAQARRGNLFEPVKNEIFNSILLNPPVSAGMNLVKTMISEAPKIMAPKSSFQMVIRSKIGEKNIPQTFIETFGNCRIVSRSSGYRVLLGEKN